MASSASLSMSESVLDIVAARGDASANTAAAWSTSSVSSSASACMHSAVSRQTLHAGSWATAKIASASICSGPAAHMPARIMARADSNDAEPSAGT